MHDGEKRGKADKVGRGKKDNLRCSPGALPAGRNYCSPWTFFHFNIAKIQYIYLQTEVDLIAMEIADTEVVPIASIVTVADYKAGHQGAWADLQRTLQGLQAQDFDGPVELMLVCAEAAEMSIPDELQTLIPGTRVLRINGETSYDLKNAAAQAARSDWVIILRCRLPSPSQLAQ